MGYISWKLVTGPPKKARTGPGQVAQLLVGTSSCTPKGCRFDPWSGQYVGCGFSPVGVYKRDDQSMLLSLFLSLPLFLSLCPPPSSLSKVNRHRIKRKQRWGRNAELKMGGAGLCRRPLGPTSSIALCFFEALRSSGGGCLLLGWGASYNARGGAC
ncbi:hypothetical protein HJG60_008635 [Phyllostomus discolor]|uniref:Uncharacterized protein n=1 Tax=Phyllostomus discolor TaxID=89673 RepID=A0A834DLL9_9CHIR|nr:hypothetical protein HJG60_008635 [Phyllostomus discolor]